MAFAVLDLESSVERGVTRGRGGGRGGEEMEEKRRESRRERKRGIDGHRLTLCLSVSLWPLVQKTRSDRAETRTCTICVSEGGDHPLSVGVGQTICVCLLGGGVLLTGDRWDWEV